MRPSPTLRPIAWILIALALSGCSSWRASHPGPAAPGVPADSLQSSTRILPEIVRLHLRDGAIITLLDPRVDGDSLRGINVPLPEERNLFSGRPEPRLGRVPRAIALKEVQQIDSRRFNAVKTLVLLAAIGGLAYVALLIAYGISLQGGSY